MYLNSVVLRHFEPNRLHIPKPVFPIINRCKMDLSLVIDDIGLKRL